MVASISCTDFAPLSRRGGFDLIDVRTPMEFFEVHAVGSLLTPLSTLNPAAIMDSRGDRRNEPLYIICRSGGRSAQACAAFEKAGFSNVVNVDGGTLAWIEAGLPVNRGQKKRMSLERQVRIAAGLIALVGSMLVMVNQWFLIVPAFIGGGLVFSGLTNTCGMGLVLAKMPWNKVAASENACCGGGSCSVVNAMQ